MAFTADDARTIVESVRNEGPIDEVLDQVRKAAQRGEQEVTIDGRALHMKWREVHELQGELEARGFDVWHPDDGDGGVDIFRLVVTW